VIGHHLLEPRDALPSSCEAAFAWLPDRYGFLLTSQLPYFVEYRTTRAALAVELVPRSGPRLALLRSHIEDLDGPPGPWTRHSQSDIAQHLRPDTAEHLHRRLGQHNVRLHAADLDCAIQTLAPRWSDLLARIDLDDAQLWAELRVAKLNRILALADDDALGRARAEFRGGNYWGALTLYERAPGWHMASDRHRIKIARSRAGLSGGLPFPC
jgi:hypothetical protein